MNAVKIFGINIIESISPLDVCENESEKLRKFEQFEKNEK